MSYRDTTYIPHNYDDDYKAAQRASDYIWEETGVGVDFIIDEAGDTVVQGRNRFNNVYESMDDAIRATMEKLGLVY